MTQALLRDILAELVRIREALERRPAPGRDEAKAAALLRLIRERVQERPFSAFDICDHVEVADAVELGASIAACCGLLSPRRLGKFLKRYEAEPLESLRVVRVGKARAGVMWQIQPASLRVSIVAKPGAVA